MENERCAPAAAPDRHTRRIYSNEVIGTRLRRRQTQTESGFACKAPVCVINGCPESTAKSSANINGFLRSRAHTQKMLN